MLGARVLALVNLAWRAEIISGFVGWTVLTGVLYTFWLICTHDAVYHTLTGLGGLQFHAVHHAFPGIPFYRLPEAFGHMRPVLHRHGQPPLTLEEVYLKTSLRLGRGFALINRGGSPDPALRQWNSG